VIQISKPILATAITPRIQSRQPAHGRAKIPGMKTTIPFFQIVLAVLCLGLVPTARAVVPPPDGGYPGFNTAEGQNALFSLSSGSANSAVGWYSLFSNTDGSFNTGVGAGTLLFNVGDQSIGAGLQNTAVGTAALLNNTTGSANTATGVSALVNNTLANANTATGAGALFTNATGDLNTAIGASALFANNGDDNTAIGASALLNNTTGSLNTAIGLNALVNNTTGGANIALGVSAGSGVVTASNVIAIGVVGADVSNSCYIGGIFNQTSSGGAAVFVNSGGQLGTATSSQRFKADIKPMEQASEMLFRLKPITFRYNKDIDPEGTSQFGLVAEDVEKVHPDLVVRDQDGQAYSVRYDQVNAMLLNEFLKEHERVEEQQEQITALSSRIAAQETIIAREKQEFLATIARQDKEICALMTTVKEQAAQIQKVSAQIEVRKAPLQLTTAESP
jgi:hypothetical protein